MAGIVTTSGLTVGAVALYGQDGLPAVGSGGLAPFVSLNAASTIVNGAALDCATSHQTVSMYVTQTSTTAPTTMTVALQSSVDNTNWVTLGSSTSVAAGTVTVTSTGAPFRYVRAAITVLTGTPAALSVTASLAVAA